MVKNKFKKAEKFEDKKSDNPSQNKVYWDTWLLRFKDLYINKDNFKGVRP